MENRKYSLVLLGPTGFTGRFVAEHITQHFPTDLSWALAGRSHRKLHELAADLQKLNPDRSPPSIEILELSPEQLQRLAQNTKVIINAIGPYSIHGSVVVEASALSGTHYLDFSTETAWIKDVIQKHEKTAKANKSIMIPAIGNSSSPSDLIAFLLTRQFFESYGYFPNQIRSSIKMKLNGMSGGSLASVVAVASRYGARNNFLPRADFLTSNRSLESKPLFTRLFGYTSHPILGSLTTSLTAPGNEVIVHRSKSLRPDLYSGNLSYQEFMPATGVFQAVLIHLATMVGIILLAFPPFRSLIDKLRPKESGSGPSREILQDETIDVDAVATGRDGQEHGEVRARYQFGGPMYGHAALLAAEAAMVLLDHDTGAKIEEEKYGFLTPSYLGMAFVERLKKTGVILEVGVADNVK